MHTGSLVNVLLVEDSPTDVLLAREVVDTYPQFRLRHVDRLSEAIRVMVEDGYDVVLLDLGLPDSQGLETLLKLLRARPNVPVVVMTARDDEELALKAVHAGAQDYLVKSQVVNGILGRAIRYAIERRHAEQAHLERAAQASLSADVGRAFTKGGSLREMLEQCAESMVRNLGGAFARIWTLNQPENVLELRASAGMYTHLDGPHSRVPVGKYKIGLIAEERKPHLTNDVAHDTRIGDPAWARREGMVAFAGYHLQVEDRLVGVMAMFARQPLSDTTLQAMASVGDQIALGIEGYKSEEELRRNEGLLRGAFDYTNVPMVLTDLDNRFTRVNPAFAQMFGYSEAELLKLSMADITHPDDLAESYSRREAILAGRSHHFQMQKRYLHKDGHILWGLTNVALVRTAAGEPMFYVGQVQNTTERKQAEAQLRQAQQRLQHVVASSPAVLYTLEGEAANSLRLTWISENVQEMMGYRIEDAMHPNWWHQHVHPDDLERIGAEIQTDLFSSDRLAHEYRFRRQDGKYRWVQSEMRLRRNDSGFPVEVIGSWSDITGRHLLEEQLRQAQKMEAIGSLAGGVAHDFNNLLTIINGYSELIQMQLAADSPMRELAREIGQAGERAASLTRQLLAFSRKQVLEPKVLSVNAIVADTAKMLQRLIGEDVDLNTVLEPSLGRVKADAGQIEQVLINLAVNARDAMPQGGKVTIETSNTELHETYTQAYPGLRPGPFVLVAVSDTGTGMDEATKARIFEPFFTTKEAGKGTGLGLATVFAIVKQSEGHIAVYTELSRGTTFKCYLPRIEEIAGIGVSGSRHGPVGHGTETILLTEDEPALRALARHVLGMHGYTVLEAGNGEKALRIAEDYKSTIHLLVTDVVMPAMSGRQLAERLTAVRTGMKVVYLSGYTDDAVVRHGVLQAKAAFLQKPFTPGALAQKVREVLDQPAI